MENTMDKPVNVCVLVGSLRKASFNGMLANALGHADKLFDEHGKLVSDGTRKFLHGFMQAFANWVETVRSQGQRI
jgi:hypothetical protein